MNADAWVWSVAFKRPRSRRLVWVVTTTRDVCAASREARNLIAERGYQGLLEYGHSKTPLAAVPTRELAP